MTAPPHEARPRLVVVYDQGAAEPRRIVESLGPVANLHFLISRSEHARAAVPFLQEYGSIQMLDRVLLGRPSSSPCFDGIVTFSERMLRDTSRAAAQLGLPFHSEQAVNLLTSKRAQRQRLADSGIDKIIQRTASNYDELVQALHTVGIPAVVKPEIGEGSRYTWFIESQAIGFRLAQKLLYEWPLIQSKPIVLVIEQFLADASSDGRSGSYVSVESAVVDGRATHIAVTGKFPMAPPFRERGGFWPAFISDELNSDIIALTDKSLRALEVSTGLCHTEVKLTPTGPRVIEVNGRLGGGIADIAQRASNIDMVRLAGEIALGHTTVDIPTVVAPNSVTFRYHHASPSSARALLEIDGADNVSDLYGVTEYLMWPLPHQLTPESTSKFDALTGSAQNHDEMYEVITKAGRLLQFRFISENNCVFQCQGSELQ